MGGPVGGHSDSRNFNAFVNLLIPMGDQAPQAPPKEVMAGLPGDRSRAGYSRKPTHVFPREILLQLALTGGR